MKQEMPETGQCPDEMDLVRFAEGNTDGAERQAIEGHLVVCPNCCEYVVSYTKAVTIAEEMKLPDVPEDQIQKARSLVTQSEPAAYRPADRASFFDTCLHFFRSLHFRPMAASGALAVLALLVVTSGLFISRHNADTTNQGVYAPPGIHLQVLGKTALTLRSGEQQNRTIEKIINEGDTLQSNDHCRIQFSVEHDAYVYVVYFDSSGKTHQLFPNPATTHPQKITGGKTYSIPPEKDRWFKLDTIPGTETVFVIAARRPIDNLEKTFQSIRQSGMPEEPVIAVKKLSFTHN